MRQVALELRKRIEIVGPQLSGITDAQSAIKPSPDAWSKKQILGHLIDSAANNRQRFVRAVYNAADQFPAYDQNQWVAIQNYNSVPWQALVAFWAAYNTHLAHILASIPDKAHSSLCHIGAEKPVTLEFVAKDYLRHLNHHLADILK